MARDKLNVYQWTWGQLRKKVLKGTVGVCGGRGLSVLSLLRFYCCQFNLALEGRVHVCHTDCQCALAKQSSNVKKYQGVRVVGTIAC